MAQGSREGVLELPTRHPEEHCLFLYRAQASAPVFPPAAGPDCLLFFVAAAPSLLLLPGPSAARFLEGPSTVPPPASFFATS